MSRDVEVPLGQPETTHNPHLPECTLAPGAQALAAIDALRGLPDGYAPTQTVTSVRGGGIYPDLMRGES